MPIDTSLGPCGSGRQRDAEAVGGAQVLGCVPENQYSGPSKNIIEYVSLGGKACTDHHDPPLVVMSLKSLHMVVVGVQVWLMAPFVFRNRPSGIDASSLPSSDLMNMEKNREYESDLIYCNMICM